MTSWPPPLGIDERVDKELRREHPDLYRFVSREVASFYPSRWYALDNFSAFAILDERDRWCATVEHGYQAGKYENETIARWVLHAPSAHEAKKRGNDPQYNADVRKDWKEFRLPYLEKLLRTKHATHEYVRKTLERSREMIIIEDSSEDGFFGRGSRFAGRNELGELWMKIRDCG